MAHFLNTPKNKSFFQTTLPIFQNFEPQIKLETFEYIAKSNTPLIPSFWQKVIEKSEGFSTSNFSNKKLEQQISRLLLAQNSFLFGQPHFLATIKKSPLKKTMFSFTDINGVNCQFSLIRSRKSLTKLSLIEAIPRKFDELPSYLKGLNQKCLLQEPFEFSYFTTPFVDQGEFFSEDQKRSKQKTIPDKIQIAHKKVSGKHLFVIDKNNQMSTNCVSPQVHGIEEQKKENWNQTKFSENRFDFYRKVHQLNNEFQTFFLEYSIYPSSRELLEKKLTNFLTVQETGLKFLEDLAKQYVSIEGFGGRDMSGYAYPDTTTQQIQLFYTSKKLKRIAALLGSEKNQNKQQVLSKNYRNNNLFTLDFGEKNSFFNGVNIELFGVPFFTTQYPFYFRNLPQFLIQTRNVLLTTPEQNQEVYSGPSLVLDCQKNFDWKTSRDDNLRTWFHNYISPLNSLVHVRENFFGNYFSPKFAGSENNAQIDDFKNNSFLRLKVTKTPDTQWMNYGWTYESDSPRSLFAPFRSSLHLVSINRDRELASLQKKVNTKEKFFPPEKDKTNNSENQKGLSLILQNRGEHFFPLIQLKQPSFSNFQEGYASLFEFGVKGDPDLTFFPGTLNPKTARKQLTSSRYKRLSSVFSKQKRSTSIFVNNWEPLTSTSWLVITQVSFAVFFFNVLKGLADNYGRELLGYLLDLVSALGILDDALKQRIEILTGQRNQGFRVFLKSRKTFTNIVGIQKLLLEIYEVVLFLRNSGRISNFSQTLPHGVLLIGPAGTGKTLLVQAISGEAEVPVIAISGSSLMQPGESASVKLQLAFEEARKLAPCIVFIDEMDTFSGKRTQMLQHPMAKDEEFDFVLQSLILESPLVKVIHTPETQFAYFQHIKPKQPKTKQPEKIPKVKTLSLQPDSEQREKKLSVLSQLLIELDGIKGRHGVVVIGATNRPEVLDSALLRPGRFDKVVHVGLPDKQKRIEILEFYSKRLGYPKDLAWEYLAERTIGFTAADLATLMNEATINAILKQSTHTIETIEHGIDRLTISETEKHTFLKLAPVLQKHSNFQKDSLLNSDDQNPIVFSDTNKEESEQIIVTDSKMSILRLAYYQAGKLLLSYLLKEHPKNVVTILWPRRRSARSIRIATSLQDSFLEVARVSEILARLTGCYGGKAAEFLFLQNFGVDPSDSPFLEEKDIKNQLVPKTFFGLKAKGRAQNSTLGSDDILLAQKLVDFLVLRFRLFSNKNNIQETIFLYENLNPRSFQRKPEKLELYSELLKDFEIPPMKRTIEEKLNESSAKKDEDSIFELTEQEYYGVPWWKENLIDEFESKPKNPANATRLYLWYSERNYRNPEWRPFDEFYHSLSALKNVKRANANLRRVMQERQEQEEQQEQERQKQQEQERQKQEQKQQEIQQEQKQQEIQQEQKSSGGRPRKRRRKLSYEYQYKHQYSGGIQEEFTRFFFKEEKFFPVQKKKTYNTKKVTFTWNELPKLPRDYPTHSLTLKSFNRAFVLLNENREVLDKLVIELLYNQILRKPDVDILLKNFKFRSGNLKEKHPSTKNQFRILEHSWGARSRKPLPKWIDFGDLRKKTSEKP
jgi:ATP-dependent 26S proteasome regulatory subunit